MAFDFNQFAAGVLGPSLMSLHDPSAGAAMQHGFFQDQKKQRAGKLGAQARSRFYEKIQQAPPGDPAARQSAIMAAIHDIQNNPDVIAADPDLIPNLLKEANTLKELMQAPEPQVLSPGSQLLGPNNEVLAQAPFAPPAPSEAEKVAAAIKEATARGDVDTVRLLQKWVPKEAQAPQGTAFEQNIQFHAERMGLDIHDPKQYLQAVESFSELQRSRQDVFNYPTGYAPTGEVDELGRPVVSPLEGTEPDVQRKAGQEAKNTIVETLDAITQGIEANPSEFGVMSGLKRAGRAAASAVEQVGTAAGQAGMPVAGAAGEAAGAIRRGPLAEGSMTYEDAKIALDELAVLMSRRGGAFSGPEGETFRQAQQEINNTRERLEAGKADIPTVLRRLRVVRNLIAGEGFAPGSAEAQQSGSLSAAIQAGDAETANKTVQKMSPEELKKLPTEELEALERLLAE